MRRDFPSSPYYRSGTSRESSRELGNSWFGARTVASYNDVDTVVNPEATVETRTTEKQGRGLTHSNGIFLSYRNEL